jgi:hypothetical protein
MIFKNSPRLTYCAAWALAGSYIFLRDLFYAPWNILLVEIGAHFITWGVLGLWAIPIMRRYPLRWHWKSCLFHLIVGGVFTQIDITVAHFIIATVEGTADRLSFINIAVMAFKTCFHLSFLTYWGLLAIVQGLDAQKLAQVRAVQVEEQNTNMVRAQLLSLKTQLQPHFLFNTLHAIASLMHYDVPTADRMLNRLSELLRITLKETNNSIISLQQEMAFIQAYLEIEKIRFEERLEVEWTIPDSLLNSSIPSFILQPLVENAIKYGVSTRTGGGNIAIRAYTENDALLLEVEDDAPDALSHEKGFGIGLSNTRSRLEVLYGTSQGFELIRAGMGTIARIRLPLFKLDAQVV